MHFGRKLQTTRKHDIDSCLKKNTVHLTRPAYPLLYEKMLVLKVNSIFLLTLCGILDTLWVLSKADAPSQLHTQFYRHINRAGGQFHVKAVSIYGALSTIKYACSATECKGHTITLTPYTYELHS